MSDDDRKRGWSRLQPFAERTIEFAGTRTLHDWTVRRGQSDPWRKAVEGESICAWDLEIIWEERQAWIETMLTGSAPDPDAYLRRVPERFRDGSDTPRGGS